MRTIGVLNELHQGNKVIASDNRFKKDRNVEMVYQWILLSASESKRSLRRQNYMGRDLPISYSTEQKLNNKISTES